MNTKDFYDECKFIFRGSCILNLVIIVVSLAFKRDVSVLLGLLLGTGILFINLNLLKHDIDNAVKYGHNRFKLMCGYLLRYLLLGCAFYFATNVELLNPYGVILPAFYPKVLYTLKSIINSKKGVEKM